MICPEYRHYWPGVERADSIVFNPHKWLGVQFDCSAHFLKNPDDLVQTLAISPEYLKTHGHDGIINYSEWSVPLGRRFRALKIWFLIRTYGLEGLRQRLRNHVNWSSQLHAPGCRSRKSPSLAGAALRWPGGGTSPGFPHRMWPSSRDSGSPDNWGEVWQIPLSNPPIVCALTDVLPCIVRKFE